MLNPDFRDMLSEFVSSGVEFLLVGAYALAAHGYPRSTGDIDLWVRADVATANKVYDAITRFGAPLHDLTPEDFSRPGIVFQIGVAPIRIDILTSIDGVEFVVLARDRKRDDPIDLVVIEALEISTIIDRLPPLTHHTRHSPSIH